MSRPLSLARWALCGMLLLACRERTQPAPQQSLPCSAFGQRCEFSPGKLGSCVLKDGCTGPNCFVCQSQH